MKKDQTEHKLDQYFNTLDPLSKDILTEIRLRIQDAFPEATETLSYGVPAFKDDKVFFYYASFKHHIGIYPPIQDEALKSELKGHVNEKGNLHFRKDEPMPYDLIIKIAKHLYSIYHK